MNKELIIKVIGIALDAEAARRDEGGYSLLSDEEVTALLSALAAAWLDKEVRQ